MPPPCFTKGKWSNSRGRKQVISCQCSAWQRLRNLIPHSSNRKKSQWPRLESQPKNRLETTRTLLIAWQNTSCLTTPARKSAWTSISKKTVCNKYSMSVVVDLWPLKPGANNTHHMVTRSSTSSTFDVCGKTPLGPLNLSLILSMINHKTLLKKELLLINY